MPGGAKSHPPERPGAPRSDVLLDIDGAFGCGRIPVGRTPGEAPFTLVWSWARGRLKARVGCLGGARDNRQLRTAGVAVQWGISSNPGLRWCTGVHNMFGRRLCHGFPPLRAHPLGKRGWARRGWIASVSDAVCVCGQRLADSCPRCFSGAYSNSDLEKIITNIFELNEGGSACKKVLSADKVRILPRPAIFPVCIPPRVTTCDATPLCPLHRPRSRSRPHLTGRAPPPRVLSGDGGLVAIRLESVNSLQNP